MRIFVYLSFSICSDGGCFNSPQQTRKKLVWGESSLTVTVCRIVTVLNNMAFLFCLAKANA